MRRGRRSDWPAGERSETHGRRSGQARHPLLSQVFSRLTSARQTRFARPPGGYYGEETIGHQGAYGGRMRAVVLVVHGLQPAYLGAYGCDWVPTPTVDRLAATGVVFDGHFLDELSPAGGPRTWWHSPAGIDIRTDLRAAGVRTAYVGPTAAPGWDITIGVEREQGPIALKPVRRALRQTIEDLGDMASALLFVETDALLPPWIVSDDMFADVTADLGDVESEEDSSTESQLSFVPWSGSLPEQLARDDSTAFQRLQRTY